MQTGLFNTLNAIRTKYALSFRERKAIETFISKELNTHSKTIHPNRRVEQFISDLYQGRKYRQAPLFDFNGLKQALSELLTSQLGLAYEPERS